MLKFTVDGQKLELLGDPHVVADSFDYLTGSFKFYSGHDWDLTEKHVFFQLGTGTPYEVTLTDDEFVKTDHVNLTTGAWDIHVVGYDIDGATLVERITTDVIQLTVERSGISDGEPFPPSIIPDVLIVKDQTTPQTFVNGVPKLAADRVIENENDMVDAKHVADVVAAVTADDFAHNSLSSLQGGSSTERYHMTQAENTALHAHSNKTALDAVAGVNTGDQSASSFNHNDLANKQGGTTNEFYHVTAAEKTVIEHTSGTNTGDQDLTALATKASTMRLLISRTIAAGENVSAITWTQDDAGNALALIDAEIRAYTPANSLAVGSAAFYNARVNDISGASDYMRSSSFATYMIASAIKRNITLSSLYLKRCGNVLIGRHMTSAHDGTTVSSTQTTESLTVDISSISKIYLYTSLITYFPEGTKIEIYGRTA